MGTKVTPYTSPEEEDKKKQVERMFDSIAHRYDFLNHFFSLGIDVLWRKRCIRILKREEVAPKTIIDMATGTGDFAIDLFALLKSNKYVMRQKGISFAGKPYSKKLLNNETIKVMTGSVIPENCDAVIMKEMVDVEGMSIYFPKNIQKNQNIRMKGEDIKKKSIVIKKGEVINHTHMGILSSLGIREVPVVIKPIVSFFSTGDELISINKKLRRGMIYDSNRYILRGLLERLPIIIRDMGVVKDNEKALEFSS